MSTIQGTYAGLGAIMLWSMAALLFSYINDIHIFLYLAIVSLSGGMMFIPIWLYRESKPLWKYFKVPYKAVLLPLICVGTYKVLYFYGYTNAPIEEANLINYLWPLFFVFFLGLLPNHKTTKSAFIGILFGFLGAFFLFLESSKNVSAEFEIQSGHLYALLAALLWAVYCILSKLEKHPHKKSVPVSFIYFGLLCLLIYLLSDDTHATSFNDIFFTLILGTSSSLGYFLWDRAMKYGDTITLSVASYFTPLLSTLLLIAFGEPTLTLNIIIATLLIVVGTLVASKEKLFAFLHKIDNFKL